MEIIRNKVCLFVKIKNEETKNLILFSFMFRILMMFCFGFCVQKVKFWKKVYVIYSFFLVRKIVAHMVTFFFYCLVIPLTILVPEVHVPIWGAVYIPSIITILNSVGTPRSDYFSIMLSYPCFVQSIQTYTHRSYIKLIV